MNRLLAASIAYFALVFGTGFALGIIRVLVLVPNVGTRTAELAEAPLMALVIWLAARWVVQRFGVPVRIAPRFGVGLIALVSLLALELTVVPWLQGISTRDAIAHRDPVTLAIYGANLLLFALTPAALLMQSKAARDG